jgi:hypothetical protein
MSGKTLKQAAEALSIKKGTDYAVLQKLIMGGFFDGPVSSEQVVHRIKETVGVRWNTSRVQIYMKRFRPDIIHAVKPHGSQQNFWVLASVPRADALRLIGKTRRVVEIEDELFSAPLTKTLEKYCGAELDELKDNYGRHGNCTAFLLRKMLEKLIIIAFSKNGMGSLLEDKASPRKWKGLHDLIETAAREKIRGVPFLIPKTANEIKGLKFLGDTAAHNPLVGVDLATIHPQMPFMITAYKELSARL